MWAVDEKIKRRGLRRPLDSHEGGPGVVNIVVSAHFATVAREKMRGLRRPLDSHEGCPGVVNIVFSAHFATLARKKKCEGFAAPWAATRAALGWYT